MRFKYILIYVLLPIMACNNHTKDHKDTEKDTMVTQVTDIPIIKDTTPVPLPENDVKYDTVFSGLGTEPFWSIDVIKDKEIVFKNSEGLEVAVPYREPGTANNVQRYISNKGRETIVLAITKKKCSDGMSETDYEYEIIAVVNTVTYRGCGKKK